jgi:single-stranded DNA-binding protein
MARHNEARLMGYLIREPILQYTDIEKTNLVRATIQIRTLRGNREFGKDQRKGYDEQLVMTQQPGIMAFMQHIHQYDIVDVKGNLITIKTRPIYTCPECGHTEVCEDTIAVVNPIFIDHVDATEELKRIDPEKTMTKTEQVERYLRKRIEISNNIAVIGDCIRAPEMFESQGIVNYALDVTRKYKIREDDISRRHDYPNIKCYGAIAKNDYKYIRKGSRVFIDGFIMSRTYYQTVTCPNCGHEWQTIRSRNEIVPYSVEYLSKCNTGFEEINNEIEKGTAEGI